MHSVYIVFLRRIVYKSKPVIYHADRVKRKLNVTNSKSGIMTIRGRNQI